MRKILVCHIDYPKTAEKKNINSTKTKPGIILINKPSSIALILDNLTKPIWY